MQYNMTLLTTLTLSRSPLSCGLLYKGLCTSAKPFQIPLRS